MDSNVFLSLDEGMSTVFDGIRQNGSSPKFYVALPFITRQEEWDGTKDIKAVADRLSSMCFDGLLVRNLEQLGFLKMLGYSMGIILDYGIYNWNKESALELLDFNDSHKDFFIEQISVPYELNFHEAVQMTLALKSVADIPVSYNVYGHIPMMISAGCIKKTTSSCSGKLHELYSEKESIVDRMKNKMTVTCNCRQCYNIIWNAFPTSLHKSLDRIFGKELFDSLRVDFTIEDRAECSKVLDYYLDRIAGGTPKEIFGEKSFTTGHFKRGVE